MPHDSQIAQVEWDRYLEIWRRQIANPELLDDAGHIADREIAHARFSVAFAAKANAHG